MLPATVFLLWGAIRFTTLGGALCVALLALQAFWYTAGGLGPYAALNRDPHVALLHLQATLAVIAILVILISAVAIQARRALADSLAGSPPWRR